MRTISRQLNGPLDLESVINTAKTIPFKSPKGKELKWWVTFSLEQPKRTMEQSNQIHQVIRLVDKELSGGDDFDALKHQMKEMYGPREQLKVYGKDNYGHMTFRLVEVPKSTGEYTQLEAELFVQNVRSFGREYGASV